MDGHVHMIVNNIVANKKRMARIRSIKNRFKAQEQAEKYAIGEAATLHIRLSAEEVGNAGALIYNRVR